MKQSVRRTVWGKVQLLQIWWDDSLTESVYKVVLQKSIPAQILQLILYISDNTGHVDGLVRE